MAGLSLNRKKIWRKKYGEGATVETHGKKQRIPFSRHLPSKTRPPLISTPTNSWAGYSQASLEAPPPSPDLTPAHYLGSGPPQPRRCNRPRTLECTNDVLYCDKTLLNLKWSNSSVEVACQQDSFCNNGAVPTDAQVGQSLFKCGASGEKLVWVNNRTPCANGCVDGGAGNSDYCG